MSSNQKPQAASRAVPKGAWTKRIFATARLMTYVMFACLVVAALGARVVYADFREATLRAGRELKQLDDVLGETKSVFFNGVQMNVSTTNTRQSTKQVLDRFQAMCEANPGMLSRAMADIPEAMHADVAKMVRDPKLRAGIIREDYEDEGALTCFTDDRPTSLQELPARLASFARSHDLAEFGRFRYVYVNRTEDGNTHVRTVWTDGSMRLDRMFPARGDAEGSDSPFVPRPPSAKRILTAAAATVPYGLHIYDSTATHDELRQFYDREMAQRGWKLLGEERSNGVVYMKDSGTMLYLALTPKDTRTLVTAVETARAGTSPREAQVTLGD